MLCSLFWKGGKRFFQHHWLLWWHHRMNWVCFSTLQHGLSHAPRIHRAFVHAICPTGVFSNRRDFGLRQLVVCIWLWHVLWQVPSGKLEVALGKLRQFNQRRYRSIKTGIFSKKVTDAIYLTLHSLKRLLLAQGNIVKNWKQRCFVLTADSLSYYQSEHSQNPKGKILLKVFQRFRAGFDIRSHSCVW